MAIEADRRMGGAGRVRVVSNLSEVARRADAAGIRHRHREYGDQDILLARARPRCGDDLVPQPWPHRELREP